MKKNLIETKKYLSVCFLILLSIPGIACQCSYEPLFCKATSNRNTIIRAVVIDFPDPFLMEVKVLDNINKEILNEDVYIYGNDGGLCTEQLNKFEINDTLILALGSILDHNGKDSWPLTGSCGLHFLRYENKNVVGKISDSIEIQSYDDFLENLFICLDMVTSVNKMEDIPTINTYPNPVSDQINIEVKASKILEVEIYNTSGIIVYKSKKYFDNTVQIETSGLSKGTFIVVIKEGNNITTTKFIKN